MHGLWPLLFSTRHSFPRDLLLLLLHSLQHRSRCETAPDLSAIAPIGAPGFPGGSSVAQGAPPRPGAQPSSPSRRRAVQPASGRPQDADPFTRFKTNSGQRRQGRHPQLPLLRRCGWHEEAHRIIASSPRVREFCSFGPAAHKLPSIELRTAARCSVAGWATLAPFRRCEVCTLQSCCLFTPSNVAAFSNLRNCGQQMRPEKEKKTA